MDSKVFELARQKLQQQQGRLVGPMQVIKNQNEGALAARILEKRRYAVKEPESCLVGLESQRRRKSGHSLSKLRYNLGDVGSPGAHRSGQCVGVSGISISPDHLNPGPESRGALALIAAAGHNLCIF